MIRDPRTTSGRCIPLHLLVLFRIIILKHEHQVSTTIEFHDKHDGQGMNFNAVLMRKRTADRSGVATLFIPCARGRLFSIFF